MPGWGLWTKIRFYQDDTTVMNFVTKFNRCFIWSFIGHISKSSFRLFPWYIESHPSFGAEIFDSHDHSLQTLHYEHNNVLAFCSTIWWDCWGIWLSTTETLSCCILYTTNTLRISILSVLQYLASFLDNQNYYLVSCLTQFGFGEHITNSHGY